MTTIFDMQFDPLAPKVAKPKAPKRPSGHAASGTGTAIPAPLHRLTRRGPLPSSIIRLISVHHCAQCGSCNEVVEGTMAEFINERLSLREWRRLEDLDHSTISAYVAHLPERLEYHHIDDAECAQCLHLRYFAAGEEELPASPFGQHELFKGESNGEYIQ